MSTCEVASRGEAKPPPPAPPAPCPGTPPPPRGGGAAKGEAGSKGEAGVAALAVAPSGEKTTRSTSAHPASFLGVGGWVLGFRLQGAGLRVEG